MVKSCFRIPRENSTLVTMGEVASLCVELSMGDATIDILANAIDVFLVILS